jgi:hypothetical protein
MTITAKSVVDGGALTVTKWLERAHHIPAYQRDFTWNRQKVRQLWRDLLDLYGRNTSKDLLVADPVGYFLGATVVIEEKNAPDDVVDGQQRLTALTSLVAVLAESARALPAKHSPAGLLLSLEKLVSPGLQNGKVAARLTFSDDAMGEFYLQSCVVAQDKADRQKYWKSAAAETLLKRGRGKSPMALLRAAFDEHYLQLSDFLGSTKGAARARRLALFARIATECVVVLRIAAGSYSNAFTIFESLNYRGVPLSQADLIKNELLKLSPPGSRDHVTNTWGKLKDVVEDIGDIDLPEAIYLCHLARYPRVNAAQLYEDVKEKVRAGLQPSQYVDLTLQSCKTIEILKNTRPAHWTDDTKWALDDIFDVLNAKLAIPFLVSAYEQKGRVHADAAEFEAMVRLCMNFTFRYMKLLDGATGTFSKAINEAALAIGAGSTRTSIAGKLQVYAPDHEFQNEFKSYSVSRPKLAYFTIYWLERELMKGSGAIPLQHGIDQHVEHIMPKTPGLSWPKVHALKTSNIEAFKFLLWRVGNLLPMPSKLNQSMKNKGIKEKMIVYAKTKLWSPMNVAKYRNGTKWDELAIEARQADLAKTAVKAWAL